MDNDNGFLEEMQNDKYINQNEIDKKQDKIDKKENKINSKITKAQKFEEKQRIARTYVCKTIIQYV